MKKLVVGLAVASVVGMSGCGDSPEEPKIPDVSSKVTKVMPVFAPGDSDIPLPNDLLFSVDADDIANQDLTLNIPVVDESDYSDPKVALSGLDGWSGVAPFSFRFKDNDINDQGADVDINPATVIPGSTVRLYEVNVLRAEAVEGTGVPLPSGPVTSIKRELTPGVDYFATYAGTQTVAIIPMLPLTPQASYMVVVTDGITDANGNAVVADLQYQVSKHEEAISPNAATAALEPVRQLVNAMENAAEAAGQPKDNIVMSYQFTVQSLGQVVAANKFLHIDLPLLKGEFPATSFTSLGVDTSVFTQQASAANLYKGQVELPYFLAAAQSLSEVTGTSHDPAPLAGRFAGAEYFPLLSLFDPLSPISDSNPIMVENTFEGGNTTYANPFVEKRSTETVPLLVSLPNNPGCPKPYPVMIFQHGITSDRTNMIWIADTMGTTCTAVVSMDLPLHGIEIDHFSNALGTFAGYTPGELRERTFGMDYVDNETGAPVPDGNVESSGAYTMNLKNLLVARDNNRQSVLDLLTLEKALMFMDVDGDGFPDFAGLDENFRPDPSTMTVSFMGHSWGGIVGNMYLAHSDYVSVAVLANTAGSLMGMIDGSEQFGDPVKEALQASGIAIPSADYSSFLFAGQTAIDDGDSIHSNSINVERNIPTLMMQVAGDNAVPNLVYAFPPIEGFPLIATAGTEPMAAMMGMTTVSATAPYETVGGTRLFSKFNDGLHSTVLLPTGAEGQLTYIAYTTAMQTQIATFIQSGGQGVVVTDPSLLVD